MSEAKPGRDLEQMRFNEALESYTSNFIAALPPEISVAHFKRMLITAVNLNPKLVTADRRSLFNEAVKCASDGLLPDGREAVLNVYPTRIKRADGTEEWIDKVAYQTMVYGIMKRMRNTGEIASITAEVVYKGDKHFRYTKGSNPIIEHEPAGLEVDDTGPLVGAYAIIKLKSGEEISDVLRRKEVLAAKAQSRAKEGLMWTKFEPEAWKKTALRRCAKRAPQSASAADFEQMTRLIDRGEEDPFTAPPVETLPPRPRADDFPAENPERIESTVPDFELTTGTGEMVMLPADEILPALRRELTAAVAARAVWDANRKLIERIRGEFPAEDSIALQELFGDLVKAEPAASGSRQTKEAVASAPRTSGTKPTGAGAVLEGWAESKGGAE